jgi:hypothetical protein
MMLTLPLDAKNEDVLQVVRTWIGFLSQDKHDEAFEMLSYAPEESWTPELIRTLIANYGSLEPLADGRTFRVTSLDSIPALPEGRSRPYQDVEWRGNKGIEGWVHFDLPLNGEFSDLTAIFKIVRVNERFALELHTIHVL